jgi:hypothetical protein
VARPLLRAAPFCRVAVGAVFVCCLRPEPHPASSGPGRDGTRDHAFRYMMGPGVCRLAAGAKEIRTLGPTPLSRCGRSRSCGAICSWCAEIPARGCSELPSTAPGVWALRLPLWAWARRARVRPWATNSNDHVVDQARRDLHDMTAPLLLHLGDVKNDSPGGTCYLRSVSELDGCLVVEVPQAERF